VADVVALSPPRSGAPPSIFALPGPGNARAKAIWRESRSVIREGRLGVNSRPLAGGPSRPPLRAKRPKRRCSGHAEPDSFDPCSLRPSGGFSNPPPSDVLQPVELFGFQHPYQNGRGSVASEKVGRERRKTARNGGLEPVLMVRTICQERPQSAAFRPRIRSGKRMSRQGVLAEGQELWSNLLCAPGRPAGGSRCKFGTLKT
jgi:hypothetical protein